jgi:hypothetical protein
MSDIVPVRRKIIKPGEEPQGRTFDDEFDDILTELNGVEAKKKQAIREELQKNYGDWAYHIGLLKEQFGEVWDLFGKIEEKVQGWYRGTSSYGQWGFMGASYYGYNFGVGIHYLGDERPVMRASNIMGGSKVLTVSFACSFSDRAGNGAGDERDVGRTSKLDDQLLGLENCTGGTLSNQLSGSKYILEKLDGHDIQFFVYNSKIGRGAKPVGIGALYDHSLKEICQHLFVRLNGDEVIDLRNIYLHLNNK